jgi:hypothetical protein
MIDEQSGQFEEKQSTNLHCSHRGQDRNPSNQEAASQ